MSEKTFAPELFLRALKIVRTMDLTDYDLHVLTSDSTSPHLHLFLTSTWHPRGQFTSSSHVAVHLLTLNPNTGALVQLQTWSPHPRDLHRITNSLVASLRNRLPHTDHGTIWKFVGNEHILRGERSVDAFRHPWWPIIVRGPRGEDT